MSETPWTKGPWKATFHRDGNLSRRGDIKAAKALGWSDCHIARTYQPSGCDDAMVEANARLIASAPELYEALDALVSERHGHSLGCVCPWCRARAALSKARGE